MTLYSLLHEPEVWLGIAIWAVGAFCGVAASWAAVEIGDRREERREHNQPDLDRSPERGGGTPAGGADQGERGGRQ